MNSSKTYHRSRNVARPSKSYVRARKDANKTYQSPDDLVSVPVDKPEE